MNPFRKALYCIFAFILLISNTSSSQNTAPKDDSSNGLLTAAREIMTASGTCTLITLDEDNNPMVRVMDPFLPESDFTVWFGTNPNSRKVNQIKQNPTVSLYYQDIGATGYVVVHGTAELVDDPKEKEKYWKEEWAGFYPNKKEAYLLIKVTPEWMEILSVPRGIDGDPTTWQTPVVRFNAP